MRKGFKDGEYVNMNRKYEIWKKNRKNVNAKKIKV